MFTSTISLAAGFSVGAAFLLALAFASVYRPIVLPRQSRIAGYMMLLGFALTQLMHARFLQGAAPELATRSYAMVLILQSLGFYWLFLGLLRPIKAWHRVEWLTPIAAIVMGAIAPSSLAILLAMLGGGAAALHLGALVYRLRAQRRWFLLEFRVLALFGFMAALIAINSILAPTLGWRYFAASYSALISLSFFLVLYLLLRFPDLVNKTEEAVAATYAVSTLSRVDRETSVALIKQLFEKGKIYQNEDLSLAKLAELVKLSSHQLSELINTQFHMSFSKLVRQFRIDAAKAMLIAEPRASVLSVGMSVGFSSQSNFYAAFKELTGMVPSQYRKSTNT
jgi:AraC-like DNA-binding protein